MALTEQPDKSLTDEKGKSVKPSPDARESETKQAEQLAQTDKHPKSAGK